MHCVTAWSLWTTADVVIGGTPRELKRQVAGESVVLSLREYDGGGKRASELLAAQPFVREVNAEDNQVRLYVEDGSIALPQILRLLDAEHIAVRSMSLSEATLDDVFLRQTGRSLRDAGSSEQRNEDSMKTALDTRLLFQRYMLQLLRNPVWLFVGFSTPVLYLLLFTPLLKSLPGVKGFPTGSVLQLFLPGILSLLAFTSGAGAGFNTIFELQSGLIERLRVTPASRLAILVGPILSGLLMMTVFDAVVVAIAVGFGFTVHWAGLFVMIILLWALATLMASFSTATALVTKDISSFAAIINGMNLPLLLLSGVLLPIALGPLWLRVLAHFNPLYYLVVAARALAVGHLSNSAVWQAFVVLIPLCALVLMWATRVFRRAVS